MVVKFILYHYLKSVFSRGNHGKKVETRPHENNAKVVKSDWYFQKLFLYDETLDVLFSLSDLTIHLVLHNATPPIYNWFHPSLKFEIMVASSPGSIVKILTSDAQISHLRGSKFKFFLGE